MQQDEAYMEGQSKDWVEGGWGAKQSSSLLSSALTARGKTERGLAVIVTSLG